jgi:recombination protein RecT
MENAGQQPVQQNNEVAIKRKQVSVLLDKMKPQIANALPRFITPEKMIRVAITAISRTPKLLECDQVSLLGAIMTSAQLGLMPDGVLGEAYLIPYNNNRLGKMECQFLIGYRGYCALALRSGQVKSIQARAVKQGDQFDYELGLEPKLTHKPLNPEGDITHFYAVIELMTGGRLFEVMTVREVNFIRDKSANYAYARDKSKTVWAQYYEEMGKKTVIRRLIKLAPLSPEINKAVGLDELADVGKNQLNGAELLDIPGAEEVQDIVYEEISNEKEHEEKQKVDDKKTEVKEKSNGAQKATEQLINTKKEKQ